MNYILIIIIILVLIYTSIKLIKSRKHQPKDRWGYTKGDYEGFKKMASSQISKQAFEELKNSAKKLDNNE